MKPGFVVMLVFGTILSLLGFSLAVAGTVGAAAGSTRDDSGYFTTPAAPLSTEAYALTSPRMAVEGEGVPSDLVTLRLRASTSNGNDVFVGIAPQADVDRYLAGVNHTEVRTVTGSPFRVGYRDIPGNAVPGAPGDQSFWTESAEGSGPQQITWRLDPGNWAIVVMNADASPGVDVAVQAGAHLGFIRYLGPLAVGLLLLGVSLLVLGLVLTVFGAIGLGRNGPPPAGGVPAAGAGPPGAGIAAGPATSDTSDTSDTRPYPARLTGTLDEGLSRWLWLVKWILVIPHVVVLWFFWFGFFVTTVVAGVAILFTGRYPVSLFRYNVGVLRWSWRVAFYSYSALGTDRYPPFSLEPAADYPADLEIDYPEHLSHGLVLVKSWLLAIPHLLVVAAFTGSATSWQSGDWGRGVTTGTPSLIGVLVLIAAVILLFTDRYRRGLFDLILGIDRWIFRVFAYTALFRDDYPPFRLDQGPAEPPSRNAMPLASPPATQTMPPPASTAP
ncbi:MULTISPECIES: DUF4389 domain-containing protein [Cryobacterium]|uniref:DUF4389 domain-containing protein n=1 Tax=Cryobacterium shii TaxID=1259235 RepID=A0AAQ2C493_9MICO|nr:MULTISPECIES: DUF4389 domain-containing protein [Cryobacterium]TFC42472.1 DUF4389 domain-containing protein [Cryobacterium shii]TFD18689.1 DUF4389 domain-containing protein [Cryobacterium sp. TMT4-10]TFD28491.1 DUF4389 domain-containing protein [Cryobacterium sp. TMT2-23]